MSLLQIVQSRVNGLKILAEEQNLLCCGNYVRFFLWAVLHQLDHESIVDQSRCLSELLCKFQSYIDACTGQETWRQLAQLVIMKQQFGKVDRQELNEFKVVCELGNGQALLHHELTEDWHEVKYCGLTSLEVQRVKDVHLHVDHWLLVDLPMSNLIMDYS